MAAQGDQALLAALHAALSPDAAVRRPAEEALRSWEQAPGFVTALWRVVSAAEADETLRWLALTCLKHAAAAQKVHIRGQKLKIQLPQAFCDHPVPKPIIAALTRNDRSGEQGSQEKQKERN